MQSKTEGQPNNFNKKLLVKQISTIKDYPITIQLSVQWGDMDSFNHVNNVMYFRYFESARIKYFEHLGFSTLNEEIGPILAETNCRFWRPLTYPDVITVGARTVSIGKSSFVMEYLIESTKLGVVATGKGVIVTYDYKKAVKAPIPEHIRAKIEDLEKQNF